VTLAEIVQCENFPQGCCPSEKKIKKKNKKKKEKKKKPTLKEP